MRRIEESGGLCSTCNNAPGCYHRATRGPALFCETFDDLVAPASRPAGRIEWASTRPLEANAGFAGLCVNCSDREICIHPRPNGGIWHCENYK